MWRQDFDSSCHQAENRVPLLHWKWFKLSDEKIRNICDAIDMVAIKRMSAFDQIANRVQTVWWQQRNDVSYLQILSPAWWASYQSIRSSVWSRKTLVTPRQRHTAVVNTGQLCGSVAGRGKGSFPLRPAPIHEIHCNPPAQNLTDEQTVHLLLIVNQASQSSGHKLSMRVERWYGDSIAYPPWNEKILTS